MKFDKYIVMGLIGGESCDGPFESGGGKKNFSAGSRYPRVWQVGFLVYRLVFCGRRFGAGRWLGKKDLLVRALGGEGISSGIFVGLMFSFWVCAEDH